MSTPRTVDAFLRWLTPVTILVTMAGTAYVSLYRLGKVEERVERVEAAVNQAATAEDLQNIQSALDQKASADDLRGIKAALGGVQRDVAAVQLDVAVICTEVVRKSGGDPLTVCRTARRVSE